MNKQDGGNRKFILVEMEDYAETITAERVRRVIDGYGEGKNAVAGTGGDFSFYELGEPLLLPDGSLNNSIATRTIREYIWYMETKSATPPEDSEQSPYYLGMASGAAYYFYYEADRVTTLDMQFLRSIQIKADQYIVYADQCIFSDEELKPYKITFKKIPRDIAKL